MHDEHLYEYFTCLLQRNARHEDASTYHREQVSVLHEHVPSRLVLWVIYIVPAHRQSTAVCLCEII